MKTKALIILVLVAFIASNVKAQLQTSDKPEDYFSEFCGFGELRNNMKELASMTQDNAAKKLIEEYGFTKISTSTDGTIEFGRCNLKSKDGQSFFGLHITLFNDHSVYIKTVAWWDVYTARPSYNTQIDDGSGAGLERYLENKFLYTFYKPDILDGVKYYYLQVDDNNQK